METGSIPLVTSLSIQLDIPAFYVHKKVKNYGLQKQLESNLSYIPAIMVEDVITPGHGPQPASSY
jgi:orotate phosphoribosyltransferase